MSREDEEGVSLGMATLEHKTERALLVVIHDRDGEKRWIPLSQIHADSELWGDSEVGDTSALTITQWFAEKEGLE